MKFITSADPTPGITEVSSRIISLLEARQQVLWLIAGGSNIPIAAEIMRQLRQKLTVELLGRLTVSLTDERYGPVGHADSNWQQLIASGFDFHGLKKTIPILRNILLEDTVHDWGIEIAAAFVEAQTVIGQFGLGTDGHIAGIQPHTPAVESTLVACGYVGTPFTRITLTFASIRKVSHAYLFAFGQSKKAQLMILKNEQRLVGDQPVQILKELSEVNIYSDQV